MKTLKKEDVFIFSVVLCDNEIDRDNERFSIETLYQLKDLYLGKTGIFDHDHSSKNQVARIFKTKVVKDSQRKTKASEDYHYLKAMAYTVRSKENQLLVKEIESGIKKEVSVGCSVKKILCSECRTNLKEKTCSHSFNQVGGVHKILEGAKDAYEWSFVAVPAQKSAGVVKKFSYEEDNISKEDFMENKYYKNLEVEARDGRRYKESLKKEIIRKNFLLGEKAASSTVKNIIEKLSVEELLEFQKSFIEAAPLVQLENQEEKKESNNEYKIRSV